MTMKKESVMNRTTAVPTTTIRPDPGAQSIADRYLATVLGANYQACHGFYGNGYWYFLIRYQHAAQEYSGTGVKLVVDSQNHAVIPLTDEQIRDLAELPTLLSAQRYGAVARDQQGYVLRSQAKQKATTYLREHLSMHYSAINGLLMTLPQPFWQFTIRLQLARVGEIDLAETIQVDAQSGQVIPLSTPQLQQVRQRADALIHRRKLASAA